MAEPNPNRPTNEPETTAPQNPPNAVLQRSARRSAVRTFVGGIALVFLIVAAVYAYRALSNSTGDPELDRSEPSSVGTTGEPAEDSPGGFDPAPGRDSTASELEFRGAGEQPQGPGPGLTRSEPLTELTSMLAGRPEEMAGRRIDLQDVEVQDVAGDAFVVRDGDARASVIAAPGGPRLSAGQRIDVSGTVEPDGQGNAWIRATRVNVR